MDRRGKRPRTDRPFASSSQQPTPRKRPMNPERTMHNMQANRSFIEGIAHYGLGDLVEVTHMSSSPNSTNRVNLSEGKAKELFLPHSLPAIRCSKQRNTEEGSLDPSPWRDNMESLSSRNNQAQRRRAPTQKHRRSVHQRSLSLYSPSIIEDESLKSRTSIHRAPLKAHLLANPASSKRGLPSFLGG
ncbi:uncharacterized protein G2W53_040968 [Senna tora]|uniref:Uncharacterized protein n=1 Tax=Senna tora TaxID=362788 RepID=A0A834SJ60_9FABA|nr:uncharacterized protein G2W53_040968 [Senna tora]